MHRRLRLAKWSTSSFGGVLNLLTSHCLNKPARKTWCPRALCKGGNPEKCWAASGRQAYMMGQKIYTSSFTCKKMHFFGHNVNSVHASDDLQVFKIPYPLEDTSLMLQKLHGVRQCSWPHFYAYHFSCHLKLDKHPGTGPCPPALAFFCSCSCNASSRVQAPTCQGCNFSKKSSYFRPTLLLRIAKSSITYLPFLP